MLVNVNISQNSQTDMILSAIGQGGASELVETGIYISRNFSFGNMIVEKKEDYFNFESLGPYGVCDDIQQVKDKYSEWINDPELKFCISFCKVKKMDQDPEGGWRWHKWGEYIGNKKPQHEYLYDEGDDIQEIFCYHIYNILV